MSQCVGQESAAQGMKSTQLNAGLIGPMPNASQSMPQVSQSIKALESALAQILAGDAFNASRSALNSQITELKRSITRSKPVGVQLDSCRAAISRAEKRRQIALDAITKAQVDLQEADVQIGDLQKDLADLEANVLSQPSCDSSAAAHVDSIQGMASALQKVLGEMQLSGAVPSETVSQAEQYMKSLMAGVQAIAVVAQNNAALQMPATDEFAECGDAEGIVGDHACSTASIATGFAAVSRRLGSKSNAGCVRSDPYTHPEVFQKTRDGADPS